MEIGQRAVSRGHGTKLLIGPKDQKPPLARKTLKSISEYSVYEVSVYLTGNDLLWLYTSMQFL